MKLTIDQVLTTVPDKDAVMAWGAMHLYPQTIRDMIRYSVKGYDGAHYAIAVDGITARSLEHHSGGFGDSFRKARKNGLLIGYFEGSDVYVMDAAITFNVVQVLCLDDDGYVIHIVSSEIVNNDQLS